MDGEELGPAEKVRKLFSFSNAALVQNRSVTAMAWNTASSDLLAVGYGKTDVFSDNYEPGEALDEGKLVLPNFDDYCTYLKCEYIT